jgi:hypothetical protein
MMADVNRGRSLRALFLAALTALFGAQVGAACSSRCDGGECTDSSEARLLDRLCRQGFPEGPACELGKGAVQSTGITGDSIGFHLGDEGGTLRDSSARASKACAWGRNSTSRCSWPRRIRRGARVEAHLDWGSCAEGCPTNPQVFDTSVTPDYHWVAIEIGQPSRATAPSLPYDAVLRVVGTSIDIADLRVSSVSPEIACSIARPIGAR